MSFFERLRAESLGEAKLLMSVPQLVDGLAGRISKATYIAYLTEAYHHVKHTTSLMRAAKAKLDAAHAVFGAALDQYVAEEEGHETWILNDIRACGADAEAARLAAPRLATEMMVAFAYDYIHRINPMGFFGMVYVLESTSALMAARGAAAVQKTLGLPEAAFSYLNSHGALDQAHTAFFAKLMEEVNDERDRAAIIHVAKRMFVLFGEVFRSIPHEQGQAHAA